MNNFIYDIPTKVYFGQGQIVHLPELIQTCGSRVLLVYGGGSVKKTGLYDTITHLLREDVYKRQQLGAASVQYALMDGDTVLVSGQRGVFAKGSDRALSADDQYAIGSVSKMFTAAAVMKPVSYTHLFRLHHRLSCFDGKTGRRGSKL